MLSSNQHQQTLFQQLLRKNHRNERIIQAYCKCLHKRYNRFIAAVQRNTEQSDRKQNMQKNQKMVGFEPDTHKKISKLFTLQIINGCVVDVSQRRSEVKNRKQQIIRKRVIALQKQKQRQREKEKKANSGRLTFKKSVAKSVEFKIGELRSPLHLKNITFQVLLNEKACNDSEYTLSKKKLTSIASLPFLLLEKSQPVIDDLSLFRA